jgi:3-oxoacyl-[acyl-carrier-protein] synthase I
MPLVASWRIDFPILRLLPKLLFVPVPSQISPVQISAYTATSALGAGKAALSEAALRGSSGLRPNDWGAQPLETWVGQVDGLDVTLPKALMSWDCRSNRLAWLGLVADDFLHAAGQAVRRYGADRVGVVVGTSTSSIGATEDAYSALDGDGRFPLHLRAPQLHTLHSLGTFVQTALQTAGPCVTLSTACSSGAKAFAVAERWLRLGAVDAVVVGGVDTLCGNVLFGFHALQLLSHNPCRPFDADRSGINLGEAASFMLLERGRGALQLLGYGESSDAHHLSAPHPEGAGAEKALDDALARAALQTQDVDFLHLHGTATRQNDEVEAQLVARRFPKETHACSTKGLTGHTLGTAGVLGAAYCLLAIETGLMPGTTNTETLDAVCGPQIQLQPTSRRVRVAMSNAFGFGGSNCVLVFGCGSSPGGHS